MKVSRRHRLRLGRVRDQAGNVLCERCEIPASSFAQTRGLLGREGVEEGDVLVLDELEAGGHAGPPER